MAVAALAVFVVCYLLIATERVNKVKAALGGAAVVIAAGIAGAEDQDSGHGVGVQPVVLCCDLRFVGVSLRGSYPILLDNR